MRKKAARQVNLAFEMDGRLIALADLVPVRLVTDKIRRSQKYAKIAASIREVGLVEPPIVKRDKGAKGKYLILDGHIRVDILKAMGQTEVTCLLATDDEAFTYNRHVNRIAAVQEHKMIRAALDSGVSKERLAKALNISIASIRERKRLLDGICPEAVELLKDRIVPINTFRELAKMLPVRQIEATQLMLATGKFTTGYAKSLVAATPKEQLVPGRGGKRGRLTKEQVRLMERETANVEREFKRAQESFGPDHMDLILAKGYLKRILRNRRVVRYLGKHHPELVPELADIADIKLLVT